VARYRLEGLEAAGWRTLSTGTTIGYRKLDRFEPRPVSRVRLRVEDALDQPAPVRIGLYGSAG